METMTQNPNATYDRIASNHKRSMLRDLLVAAALACSVIAGAMSLESQAHALTTVAPAAAVQQIATADQTDATECFAAFGDEATC